MNYSDVEVSDDDSTSPQPQQEQQSTDQSPSSSAQTTQLASKGHSTQKCGVQPNKKQQKTSNEPKKNAKGKKEKRFKQLTATGCEPLPLILQQFSLFHNPKKPKEEERVQG